MATAGGAHGGSVPGACGVIPPPSPELASLLALKLEELKARCHEKGLAVYGSKRTLAERLLSGKPKSARGRKPAGALHAPMGGQPPPTAPAGEAADDDRGSGGEAGEEEEEEAGAAPSSGPEEQEEEPDAELLARVEVEAVAAPVGA